MLRMATFEIILFEWHLWNLDLPQGGVPLTGRVDALDAANCQVRVRQSIPCGTDLDGLKEADLSVGKQEIAASQPAPPSIVFAVSYG